MTLPGFGLVRYDEIDSTNAEAIRRGEAGETGPLWIIAQSQTAGRGRRGRAWVSPRGNLMTTLLLTPARAPADWPQLSFVAALAVSAMVHRFAPRTSCALKWPNDVLLERRKVAGILLERSGSALAIGIGVNLAHFPTDTEFPATAISNYAEPPSPEQALAFLAAAFVPWYERWRVGGFVALKEHWLVGAAGLGAPIRARLTNEERTGLFEGIDDNGALLLRQEDRLQTITAGEVFF